MDKLIILPRSLLALPPTDRDAIIAVLKKASTLPATKQLKTTHQGDEHNMWVRNGDPLLAEAEDRLYRLLMEAEATNMAKLFVALGLPFEDVDLQDRFEKSFHVYEDELMKAYDSGRNRMSDYIKGMAKKAKEKVVQWTQDGKALTRQQLKKLDSMMSSKLPNYDQLAEGFMIRAGFIGKLRRQADQDNMQVLGGLLDRVPQTLTQAQTSGATIMQKKGGTKQSDPASSYIAPLTKRELDSVTHASHHAGDKLTEIADKHRAGVRQLVIQGKRERWSAEQLASKLFDKFGDHNRDWRRVAITELAFAHNDTFLAGCEEGVTVIGMGASNACKHCQEYVINKTFTVTHKIISEDQENYHTDMNLVWAGKSNYGRRVAEYRPAIPMHPNCRCRWHVLSRFYKMGDNGTLELKSTAELIQEERKKRGMDEDPNLNNLSGQTLTQEELAKRAEEVLRKLNGN